MSRTIAGRLTVEVLQGGAMVLLGLAASASASGGAEYRSQGSERSRRPVGLLMYPWGDAPLPTPAAHRVAGPPPLAGVDMTSVRAPVPTPLTVPAPRPVPAADPAVR